MTRPRFASVFSGAGGLDLGFEQAGWDCVYASDLEPTAVETLRQNQLGRGRRWLQDAFLEQTDIRLVRGREVLAKAGYRKGDLFALVGGPPCQSWSSAGHQLGFEDPRGRLFADYIRVASELDVRWLVFENVRGLLTARGRDGEPGSALELIRRTLLDAGFQTEVNLLNAADFGVPQRRVRLFMIGFRRGDHPPFPEPSHSNDADLLGDRDPWVTLRECLGGIRPPTGEEVIRPSARLLEQLRRIPDGCGVRSPGKAESTRPGGHWGYKQGAFIADLALPARTVTASSQQDWVRDPKIGLRRLCPRECAAIQTFPTSWEFVGNRSAQYRLIGNAVPPKLARSIGTALKGHVALAQHFRDSPKARRQELLPLRPTLVSAIEYTRRDGERNGESRKAVSRRKQRRA